MTSAGNRVRLPLSNEVPTTRSGKGKRLNSGNPEARVRANVERIRPGSDVRPSALAKGRNFIER
jgi:hypothetical protein